jgi:hypothetical protein
MPINIYSQDPEGSRIAWLCDDNWTLIDQSDALEQWLQENRSKLKTGRYIADIGFTPRKDALGGGAAFSSETLRIMADLGMALFISEYTE